MNIDTTDPDESGQQLEMFPQVNIYLTATLETARGWGVRVSVQTPDGRDVIQRWSRAGGSIPSGLGKMSSDLETAMEIACQYLQAFADEP